MAGGVLARWPGGEKARSQSRHADDQTSCCRCLHDCRPTPCRSAASGALGRSASAHCCQAARRVERLGCSLRATEKLRWQFRPIASWNKQPPLRPVNVKTSQECTGNTALRILRHGSGRYVDRVARVCVAEQHPLSVEPVEVRATI